MSSACHNLDITSVLSDRLHFSNSDLHHFLKMIKFVLFNDIIIKGNLCFIKNDADQILNNNQREFIKNGVNQIKKKSLS